jgi:4-amino-4-deoxy-L-arabinose transferase-like glycosyltransferase
MSINITKQTSKIPWYILIIGILGILLRTWHLFFISFAAPFHLGGLYYEFSRQIIVNNFALPHNIPFYSPGGLPFVYPPLSFYIQAIVLKFFSPSNFLTVDLLPPLLTALSVPLFYWMIVRFTEDPRLQAAALFAFAFMPSAFVNQIEGAGLAEACGTLALLAYLGILFNFLKKPGLLNAFIAGIFLGLSVLSSPGSAYGAVIILLIFFLVGLWKNIKDRSFRISALLLMTALTGLVISSPYWLTIILHGELGIFVNAFFSQHANGAILNQIRYLITFKPADMILFVSDEGVYGFLFDWLILAGLIWAVLNKNGMTVVLFFSFWLIPRLGSWLVAIPGALLAGLGIVYLIWPLFQKAFSNHKVGQNPPLMPGILLLMLVLVIIASPILAVHDMLNRVELQFTPEKVAALRAEQTVIPSDAHVLVVGNGSLIEWAPALLQREVVNCQFGLEWKPKDLQEVYRINDALAMHDLAKAMAIIHAYTGDTMVWLVGEPALFTKLAAVNDPSLVVAIQDQSSELVLATIQIK